METVRAVASDDVIEIRPRALRRLLLTFDNSIQCRIPEMLGDDDEECVDTSVRLLHGTIDEDLGQLLVALSIAVERPADERHPLRHGQLDRERTRQRPHRAVVDQLG